MSNRESRQLPSGTGGMLTAPQLRAARSILRWNPRRAASAAGVGIATVSRSEIGEGVPAIRAQSLALLQSAYELAGIVFLRPGDITPSGGGVGIREPISESEI
jgi:hypothetical protein